MIWNYLEVLSLIVLKSAPYLLIGLILGGLIKTFLPRSFLIRHLGNHSLSSALKAALFGIPLPLCSCGVLPTAVSLYRQGASLPATFAFLVTTPQTSIDAILLAYGLLGGIFAIAYPISALFGAFLTSLALIIFVKNHSKSSNSSFSCSIYNKKTSYVTYFREKIFSAVRYSVTELFAEIAKPLFIGFLAAAMVTLILPQDLAEKLSTCGLTYLAMLIIGLPVYVCATASIPLGCALLMKGFSPGSILVFLIAGPATNLTSLSVLSKTFGKKVTGIYLISLSLTALLSGIALDYLVDEIHIQGCALKSETYSFWHYISAGILLLMFLAQFLWKSFSQSKESCSSCCNRKNKS